MPNLTAPCGLDCRGCPAYIATQANDNAARRRLAGEWSTPEIPLVPEDMVCDGCLAADDRILKFCRICDIRRCALDRGAESCAHCDSYPCNKLDKVSPEQRAALERIRASR